MHEPFSFKEYQSCVSVINIRCMPATPALSYRRPSTTSYRCYSLLFQTSYGIPLSQITFLVTFNFGIQLVTDLIAAAFVDKIGYRISCILAHVFRGTWSDLSGNPAGSACRSLYRPTDLCVHLWRWRGIA